jgi:HEAT repeat protein
MRTIALVSAFLLSALTSAASAADGPARAEVADKDRIPELIKQATEGLTSDRVKAVAALGAISDEKRLTQFRVPESLLGLLNDEGNNSVVRCAAAEALAKIVRYVPDSADTILKPMLTKVQDARENDAVRLKIAQAMAGFLDAEAVSHRTAFQALLRIAGSRTDRPSLVAEVLRTLGRAGYRDALPAVLAALRDEDDQIRAAALEALEAVLARAGAVARTGDMVAQLVAIITDDKVPVEVRIKAMDALVGTLRAGADIRQVASTLVEVLGKACDKKEPELAAAVVRVLYRVPEKTSVDALRKTYTVFMTTPNAKGFEDVRVAVAVTLGEYFHPLAKPGGDLTTGQEVAKLLVEISQKEPPGFNRAPKAAAASLGMMDSRKYDRTAVVADLVDAMARDQAVRDDAYFSLTRITGADAGKDPKKWEEWYKKNKDRLGPERDR